MNNQILSALNWRYATKQFDPTKKIDAEILQTLTEAIRLSPSSYGLQPWKFLIVTNPEIREKLKAAAWGQPQITDASHLVVFTRRTDVNEAFVNRFIESTAEIRGIQSNDLDGLKQILLGYLKNATPAYLQEWTAKQVYIPLGILLETAALLKVDACPMEGFDNKKFDEILGLHERNLSSVVLCALGYRASDDKYATLAKSRFEKEEVIETI
ncbi:NAD(P)H-dependent oxidoreductase [Candidatus Roizmanbacteria bacterium]|nr:NAD(P)H-dependent oxidoreductase [Candidatus Roizmanbacteria bacterium]